MTLALKVTDLSKYYGSFCALQSVSFSLECGQTVALLGPNGSGKTTIIRCIAGLLKPDSGEIEICGMPLGPSSHEARRHCSYVPQQASFPASVRVSEVLEFHAALRDLKEESVEKALQEARLGSEKDRSVGELSGGMRQRLSLAIAGMAPVKLMLLDEPTASLDPQAALRLRQQAVRWRDQGRAILFSTHVLSDAEELADQVVVIVQGKIIRQENLARLRADLRQFALLRVDVGKPTEVHRQAALASGATQVQLNSSAMIIRAPVERRYAILEKLSRLGEINHFDTEEPSIERIYMQYTEGDQPPQS